MYIVIIHLNHLYQVQIFLASKIYNKFLHKQRPCYSSIYYVAYAIFFQIFTMLVLDMPQKGQTLLSCNISTSKSSNNTNTNTKLPAPCSPTKKWSFKYESSSFAKTSNNKKAERGKQSRTIKPHAMCYNILQKWQG